MPLKEIKYKDERLDGRRKLTTEQREEIYARYKAGGITMKQLAEDYHVSKRLILVITNPESAKKMKERNQKHWRDYYNKDEHRKAMASYREKKRSLGLMQWKTSKRKLHHESSISSRLDSNVRQSIVNV